MINLQFIFSVELFIVMLIIMVGICLAVVYVIVWVILVFYIGVGGFGDMIFSGLNNYQLELIFGGIILVIILVFLVDVFFGLLENCLMLKVLREGE